MALVLPARIPYGSAHNRDEITVSDMLEATGLSWPDIEDMLSSGDEDLIWGRIEYPSLTLRSQRPCHDCGAIWGSLHILGCDWEECPICHGQLLSCDHLHRYKEIIP